MLPYALHLRTAQSMTFNSLFEMRRRGGVSRGERRGLSFNSLFEMRSPTAASSIMSHSAVLSILYLRCGEQQRGVLPREKCGYFQFSI